ncbi:hypothetical protein Zmor_008783 [Zophobas morio]|jgi:hypothetical protein|uniref:Uncharacterized protein n=1 Tax=Zophobas morio TaxID=2755281 RepID=A0AA38HKC6_9CUCU|nr:hypothetical protein Zmor_008783 [Zophobas morio]
MITAEQLFPLVTTLLTSSDVCSEDAKRGGWFKVVSPLFKLYALKREDGGFEGVTCILTLAIREPFSSSHASRTHSAFSKVTKPMLCWSIQ